LALAIELIVIDSPVFAPTWKDCELNVPSSSFTPLKAVWPATVLICCTRCRLPAASAARSVAVLVALEAWTGQFAHPLQRVGDALQAAFSRLRQGDAVVGVARSLVETVDLRSHPGRDGEAGGVVLGAVDAQAGGQALQRGGQRSLRHVEAALRVQRRDVGVDDLGHFPSPITVELTSGCR
jgi:hypothetical protein